MKASSWLTLLPRISLRNLFEIAIISFLVYEILFWIKNTRAWTLLKGLLTIMVFAIVAVLLRLDTIVWILKNITTIAVTAFLVVFQPELRKALEQLGSQNLLSGILAQDDGKSSQEFNDRNIILSIMRRQVYKKVIEIAPDLKRQIAMEMGCTVDTVYNALNLSNPPTGAQPDRIRRRAMELGG